VTSTLFVALPIDDAAVETQFLFDDAFILATRAAPTNAGVVSATQDMLAEDRLLLLEEGHRLRDRALS
jgi:LysR family hydrogen peroxide-inducible transcriptional activator